MASRESARRFQFLREIASGGFGSVFLAKVMHADGFSRLVAIKLLHRRWSENKEIAQRMRDEARLLGWLRHRNIVDVIDLTSIDGRAAVIMEYLEAVDLKSVVQDLSDRGDRIPPYAALEIVSFVASALDAAYNRPPYEGEKPLRVIHRDIKPSNIMVDESGTVKVLDFGVARGEFENRESHTQELNFGSVEYMPPERLFFEPETDRADVYSLGATLFEFLAGERLGKAKGRGEKHAAFLEDRLSYLSARCPLPNPQGGDLAKFIRDMCAYNADNRPSAEALVLRARQLARQMPGPALAEFAEQVVKPLVAAQSRAPREPNPLTEKVLPEDSTLFGAGEMVDRSTTTSGAGESAAGTPAKASALSSSGSSSSPAAAVATSAAAEGVVAEVPRDDARWEALRKAALAEMAVSEAPPVLAPSFGPSLASAQALDPALVDGYDDEPTRIGSLPTNIAAVAKAPVAEPVPVRTSKSPGISPMIAAAPPPVDDLSSEEMPVLAPPPGTGGISAPMPRALKESASREATVPGTPAVAAVPEAGVVPSTPEPLPIISAPGGYSGLDPISAEVAVGPAEALDLDAPPSAEVLAPVPVPVAPEPPAVPPSRPPPAAFTFVPEAPPNGLASASMTMVPLDDADPEGAPTSVLPVSAPPPAELIVPVATIPPSSATMVPDADFEPASQPATPAAVHPPAPAAKSPSPPAKPASAKPLAVSSPPSAPAPVKSASARPQAARPDAPVAPASPAPTRPARAPEPRPALDDPPPEAGKSNSMILILGGAAAIGVLGGLLIAAMVLGYTWYTSREAPAPTPVVAAPAVAPSKVAAAAPAAGPNDVTFVSAAADTLKVTASCGGKDTTGTESVVVVGPVSGPCVVKLVKKDRSRVIAEVAAPSAGTYTCFAGDAKACVN